LCRISVIFACVCVVLGVTERMQVIKTAQLQAVSRSSSQNGRPCSLAYGVRWPEVQKFIAENPCVGEFLGRYPPRTVREYGRTLCMFFKWLGQKGLTFTPEEFIEKVRRGRRSLKNNKLRWGLRLVLQFTRDNPDLAGKAWSYKYHRFNALRQFCAYNEAELTTVSRVFETHRAIKYRPRPVTVDDAKEILGCLQQRERAIIMVMLQSGMSIGDVLKKFNFMKDHVVGAIRAGSERIRVDFDERKRNNFSYFTFISGDAIQELRKWLGIRQVWLRGKPDPGAIFITQEGKPFAVSNFNASYVYALRKAKLKKGPYSCRSHLFRKFFKTESRPPERGIDQRYVEFMLGHINSLDSSGGTYDRSPEVYAPAVEAEYAKLERYLNIYTEAGGSVSLSDDQTQKLLQLAEMLSSGKLVVVKENR